MTQESRTGRLFSVVFHGRLNRTSILLHLQIPDLPGLQVFRGALLIDPGVWLDFEHGDTVFIRPAGRVATPIVTLAQMLQDAFDWTTPSPIFSGPHFPAFQVLSDGSYKVISSRCRPD